MEGLIDGVLPATAPTFQLVARESGRLQRLVQDLEELSRVEAGVPDLYLGPVPVERLADAVVARLGRQFDEKGVSLAVDIAPDLPPLLGDEGRLVQVLLNLVGNALQYTPPGGRVRVSAVAGACPAVPGSRDGQPGPGSAAVCVSVADSGIGIAPEHLPHVFTRFYRVDRSRSRAGGGSGIGLTIARHLVEAHGGTIRAESPGPDRGSIFYVTLPAAPA
jgi:histidine kinase